MSGINEKGKSFEERLKETLAALRESDEAFDRWLRERGLDRGSIQSAAAGKGVVGSREMMEALETAKKQVEEELRKLRSETSGDSGAEEVLGARWADLGLHASSTVAYLCGNPGMVAAAEATLASRGMAPQDLHRESYWVDRGGAAPA